MSDHVGRCVESDISTQSSTSSLMQWNEGDDCLPVCLSVCLSVRYHQRTAKGVELRDGEACVYVRLAHSLGGNAETLARSEHEKKCSQRSEAGRPTAHLKSAFGAGRVARTAWMAKEEEEALPFNCHSGGSRITRRKTPARVAKCLLVLDV